MSSRRRASSPSPRSRAPTPPSSCASSASEAEMSEHELEIEILKDGSVKAHITGAKGDGCLAYAKLLESIVGKLASQELTSDYYEQGPPVRVKPIVRVQHDR